MIVPYSLAVDAAGNIYIDDGYCRIRKVDIHGIITTVAGSGKGGYSPDGGLATSSSISTFGLTVDGSGSLYFADFGSPTPSTTFWSRIRKVDANGILSTIAGVGIGGFSGDGGPATSAEISVFSGLTFDGAGNLYIGEGSRIRKVGLNGIITTIAGDGLFGFSGDGGPATSAEIGDESIAADTSGNVYFSDDAVRIRKIDSKGIITTIAGNGTGGFSGDGGLATNAEMAPVSISVDNNGNIYSADRDYTVEFLDALRVRKIDTSGLVNTIAGNGTIGFNGDGKPAISAQIDGPTGIALDSNGNLFVGDFNGYRIRKVDINGTITTAVGDGHLCLNPPPFICAGDGGAATSAQIGSPYGIALDSSGNLYIAQGEGPSVRKVNTAGVISTVAGNGVYGFSGDGGPATSAQFQVPLAVAVDNLGNLYIGDSDSNRIRKVDSSGIIQTIAGNGTSGFAGDGGPATSAEIDSPLAVAVDGSGNLYIGDTGNMRVRKVDAHGVISTIAGNGTEGDSGDGGPATSAELGFITGLALDKSGNLYVADGENNKIRMVDTNGAITTVAGEWHTRFQWGWGTGHRRRVLLSRRPSSRRERSFICRRCFQRPRARNRGGLHYVRCIANYHDSKSRCTGKVELERSSRGQIHR